MAKRFTDSEKFRDTWYRKLTPVQKCIWEYMLSECSIAGILNFDLDAMSFQIGEEITEKDLVPFENKIFFIKEDVVFIPAFVVFQNGKRLNPAIGAHRAIIKQLEENDIDPITLAIKNKDLEIESRPSMLRGSIEGLPSIGNGNSNIYNKNIKILGDTRAREKNSKEEEIEHQFAEFYAEYPLKKSKKAAQKKFAEIISSKKISFEQLMDAVKAYKMDIAAKGTEARYIKHPSTWLNQECWLDEYTSNDPPEMNAEEKRRQQELIDKIFGD